MSHNFFPHTSFIFLFTALLISLLTIVSCNEDTNSALEFEPEPAIGRFLVTGTVNREVSGEATFQIKTLNNTTALEIIILDELTDEFQLDLFLTYQGDGQIPGTGTYSIGGDPDEADNFRAYLTFFGSGFGDGVLFSTDLLDDAGILIITESTAERISGTFQFDAQTFDLPGDEPAFIAIQNGEFSAVSDILSKL